MWKRGEIAPKEQFLLFPTLFYIYISNFRSQITYSFVKYGCSIYCFPHSQLWYVEVRISRSVSVSPLKFEIMRVDCIKISDPGHYYNCFNIQFFNLLFIVLCAVISNDITKTRLFKYTEHFTIKTWKFSDKNIWYFSYFCSKHRLWVLVRTASSRRF